MGAQTGEARSTSYLFQRLSVAIQRGNAAAVMGCAQVDFSLTVCYVLPINLIILHH